MHSGPSGVAGRERVCGRAGLAVPVLDPRFTMPIGVLDLADALQIEALGDAFLPAIHIMNANVQLRESVNRGIFEDKVQRRLWRPRPGEKQS